ncbi:hypothetical protein [Acidovorax sp. NB1]|uniref:hypothetical protein n=1 Tax=Acidovorax sp. NB1 TaxID=1943571 RepID=UPI0010F513E0|nr:hypothetical protein [Acidovorax sp. NB1]
MTKAITSKRRSRSTGIGGCKCLVTRASPIESVIKIADAKTAGILNLGLREENENLLDSKPKRRARHGYCEDLQRSMIGVLGISMKRISNPAH